MPSMSNDTEGNMNKRSQAKAQREAQWRARLARFVSSGQTILEFCRAEGV